MIWLCNNCNSKLYEISLTSLRANEECYACLSQNCLLPNSLTVNTTTNSIVHYSLSYHSYSLFSFKKYDFTHLYDHSQDSSHPVVKSIFMPVSLNNYSQDTTTIIKRLLKLKAFS
jgi:hypothetical protein